MGTEARIGVTRAPGLGLGWTRVAQRIAKEMPPSAIDGIWLFAPVRREEREWGTAVVSRRAADDRRRIYTASYLVVIRGRERGEGKVVVEEVGESSAAVIHDVIAGVQERAGEAEPPVEIAPELWYGEARDESAAEG